MTRRTTSLIIGILALAIIGGTFATPFATKVEAQSTKQANGCDPGQLNDGTFGHGCHTPVPGNKFDDSQQAAQGVTRAANSDACGLFHPIVCAFEAGANILLGIAGLLTQLGGVALNFAMYQTVLNMKTLVGQVTTLSSTWATVRDLANMGFIFVLLYAAIQTVLGIGKDNKKLIVNMVVAALLINFSLFFTKVIIDASNLIALLFYNALVPSGPVDKILDAGISNNFMEALKLQSLWSSSVSPTILSIITTGIMGSIVLVIASFSFFAVAIMLAIRFVILILVMVLSPIAFVANILPGVGKYSEQFWNTLIGQAFFAPIYLMLTWVTINIISSPGFKSLSSGNLGDAVTKGVTASNTLAGAGVGVVPTQSTMGIILNFIIVIVFMNASIIIAKSWADKAGGGVSKLTTWATNTAGKLSFGTAGRIGRGTLGRAGAAVGDSEYLKDKAVTGNFVTRNLARASLAAGRNTSEKSFDFRNVGAAEALKAGKGQSGGFAKDAKNKIKEEKDYADSLKVSDVAQYKAEQDMNDVVNNTANSDQRARIEKEKNKDADRFQGELDRLNKSRASLVASGASHEELGEVDNQIKLAERDLASTQGDLSTYAKSRVDRIKGVNEDEAKKRAAKDLGLGDNVGELNRRVKDGDTAALAALDNRKAEIRDSVNTVRKTQYARGLQEGRTFGKKFDVFDRVGIFGKVKKENIGAAIEIRKSVKEKSKEKKLAEAAAAIAEDNEAGGTTTPAGGAPATPAAGAGGTTPPPATP